MNVGAGSFLINSILLSLGQYPTHSRHLINICFMNKWMNSFLFHSPTVSSILGGQLLVLEGAQQTTMKCHK